MHCEPKSTASSGVCSHSVTNCCLISYLEVSIDFIAAGQNCLLLLSIAQALGCITFCTRDSIAQSNADGMYIRTHKFSKTDCNVRCRRLSQRHLTSVPAKRNPCLAEHQNECSFDGEYYTQTFNLFISLIDIVMFLVS